MTLKQMSILIIEDSPDDCMMLIRTLKKAGIDPQYKRVDNEAEMKTALADNWDIVLSDYSMPKFTGTKALEVLHASKKDIPFIIISGTIGEELAVEIMRAGASDYILKHNMSRLVPAIRRECEAAVLRSKNRTTEQILINTENQLRHAQKMEAIGLLAGGVAHDFNNMLSVMQIYCKKIKDIDTNSIVHQYVDKILNVQARSVALTRQLLIFSRRQPTIATNLDLNSVINGLMDMLQRLLGESIEIQSELAPNLNPMHCNQGHLEQILMNLSVNARDAMPKGGKLTFRTSAANFTKAKTVGSNELAAGDYICLEVTDSGTGIGPEVLQRIFEPFYTTKSVGTGTGLGLSIVYGIVHQHRGGVEVTSKVGQGTTFHLYFPFAYGDKVVEAPVKSTTPSKGGSETILLVEDEEELVSLISELLKSAGYRVISATNGEIALEILNTQQEPIDLVLTDMVMPKLGGKALHGHAVMKNEKIRFIYMSGYFAETPPETEASQGSHFLEKPFSKEDLLQKVRTALDN